MRLVPHELIFLLLSSSTFLRCASSSLSSPQLCLPPLGLPAAPSREPGPTQLDVGGEAVSLLDDLGPLVVSKDGTLARISTWERMDELERARVLRVLGKRNRKRLNVLKKAHGESQVVP